MSYATLSKLERIISYSSFALGLATLMTIAGLSSAALAQSDRYHITAAEKTACTADATRLCWNTYPDEDKLLGCMRANRASLTPSCLAVFDAGLRRRRLVSR